MLLQAGNTALVSAADEGNLFPARKIAQVDGLLEEIRRLLLVRIGIGLQHHVIEHLRLALLQGWATSMR